MQHNNEIALVVNTISKNSDIWKPFFDSIDRYVSEDFFSQKYVFVDDDLLIIPQDYDVVRYDTGRTYKEQFCSCIEAVKQEYCIYISEDYILYNTIDEIAINQLKEVLNEDSAFSFIRFMNMQGLFCYYGEDKRGLYHYDSKVFPHISTALVKGRWNMSEYPQEMTELIKEYKINIMNRGWV